MANLSAERRKKMLAYLDALKLKNPDESDIQAINEIELALTEKRYGLVWEEHTEQVDEELKTKIPVFTQEQDKSIIINPNDGCNFLLEGDNLHSLYLLEKTHGRKIDVIYIDPPYNTGNKDWKYDNDYVDLNDSFKHSKWISFMHHRLTIAKKLLNPDTGVLIVTIDEHEQANLRLLLDELFPEAYIQMVTMVINPKGSARGRFSRVEEHAIYCFMPNAFVTPGNDSMLGEKLESSEIGTEPRWASLLRSGSGASREENKNLFYPVLIDENNHKIVKAGDPYPWGNSPDYSKKIEGYSVAWPIRSDHTEGRWMLSSSKFNEMLSKGYVKLGNYDKKRNTWVINYLSKKYIDQINSGALKITGYTDNGQSVIVKFNQEQKKQVKTVWHRSEHDAGANGSDLLKDILGKPGSFSFPKSLYVTKDAISMVARENKNAVILDFFAGSGTTGHAILKMNQDDGGSRKFILCTNNENGICSDVTYPRLKTVITGERIDSTRYSDSIPANLLYYKTGFIDRFPLEDSLNDALLTHTPEMIQLQNMTVLNKHCLAILDEDEIDESLNFAAVGAKVYVANDVFMSPEQRLAFQEKGCKLERIPEYYFNFELKEVGE